MSQVSYLEILHSEFAKRTRRNASYSLRAFARDINMSPSSLSEVLSGKHGLSRAKASKVAERLQFKEDVKDYFCDLVESVHGRTKEKRSIARAKAMRHEQSPRALHLTKDIFDFIADWYHLAILSLMECESFRSDVTWIAQALAISEVEVRLAVDRLKRLGFIREENGQYVLQQNRTFTPAGTSREAMLAFHEDVISKALASVREQTADERELSTSFVPIPADKLDDARLLIREFRKRFLDEFYHLEDKDKVYCLAMQFFVLAESSPEKRMH